MNEQTAIELLKIANDLALASLSKMPDVKLDNQIKGASLLHTDIFEECAKAVHKQYKLLTVGAEKLTTSE